MRKSLAGILLALLTTLGVFVAAAAPAGAAPTASDPQPFGQTVNFTGTGTDKAGQSHDVTGVLDVEKVVRHGDGAALLGDMTVTDLSTDRSATRNVSVPGNIQTAAAPTPGAVQPAAVAAAAPGEC